MKKAILTDPYAGLPKGTPMVRINTTLPRSDWERVKRVRLSGGTITLTLNQLWHKLATAMDHYGLNTAADCERFEQFLQHSRLVAGSPPAGEAGNPANPAPEAEPAGVR